MGLLSPTHTHTHTKSAETETICPKVLLLLLPVNYSDYFIELCRVRFRFNVLAVENDVHFHCPILQFPIQFCRFTSLSFPHFRFHWHTQSQYQSTRFSLAFRSPFAALFITVYATVHIQSDSVLAVCIARSIYI